MWKLRFLAEIPSEPRPRQRKRAERRAGKPRHLGLGLAAILAGLYALSPSGPQARLEPNALEFETQTVGAASPARTVTLANQGAQPLAIQGVALTGEQAKNFTLASNTCGGASLDPGQSCTMTVSFSPQEAGLRQAELRIVDNAADSPHSIVLRGTGMALPPPTPGVAISPPLLEFGGHEIPTASAPQGITFTSTGTLSLEITRIALAGEQAGEFDILSDSCSGTTVVPGDHCTIQVRFTPAGTGSRRADLQVFGNTGESPYSIPLTGSGTEPPKPVAVLNPPRLDFQEQTLQASSTPQRITVSNQGSGFLQIATVSLEGDTRDFAVQDRCSGRRLAGTESCPLDVSFVPSRTQVRTATLVVTDNSSDSPHRVALSGVGTPVPKAIAEVRPENLDFEDQEVQTASGPRIVRIVNRGTAPLGVQQVRLSGPGRDAYQLLEDSCSGGSLEADESCRMQVRFAPQRTGLLEAALIITDDAEGSPRSIALSGTGTAHAEPAITIRPTTLDFGQREIGSGILAGILVGILGPKRIEVIDTGTAPLSIRDLRIEGENASDFAITDQRCARSAIAPNQTCRISVNFQPREPGPRNAVLVIQHNAPGSPQSVALSGTGQARAVGRLAVDPTMLDFGDRALRTRTSLVLTVMNTGSGPLTIQQVTISGTTLGGFEKTGDRCEGRQIPSGRSCVITIDFAPTTGKEGPRSAILTISHDGEGGRQEVELRGRVTIPIEGPG